MNYSLPHDCDNSDKVYEVRKPWNQLASIYREIEKYPDRRINIVCDEKTDIEKLFEQVDILKLRTENYTISTTSLALLRVLLTKGYNTYLDVPATEFESFYELQQLGVTDIVIDGPIGFDMPTLQNVKNNTKIRVNPMKSYNIFNHNAENVNSFFIRPENIDAYEDYIDICVLSRDVELDIYTDKLFIGSLHDFCNDINNETPNYLLPKDFVNRRLNCKQGCKRGVPCQNCHFLVEKTALLHEISETSK